MKILYAIQGTGNGHITVAREVIPLLKKKGKVDILVSGTEVDVDLPYEVKYRMQGLCFVFGKKGGIDYLETFKKANVKQLFRDIQALPVEDYDLVISDFEPVSAWASKLRNRPCIGFSHQAAVVNKRTPRPARTDLIGQAVLKHYAPVSHRCGFHYLPYDHNIFTPVIRKEVRGLQVHNNRHYTVYLPAYSDQKILRLLFMLPEVRWEVFSKHCSGPYVEDNVSVRPVDHGAFLQSLAGAEGVLCGAGFQTPAEVMFLRKKLIVIPMKGQYEQQCNAAALKLLGVPVLKNLKRRQYLPLKSWVDGHGAVKLDFPDDTEYILDDLLEKFALPAPGADASRELEITPGKFRNLLLKKIFYQLKS